MIQCYKVSPHFVFFSSLRLYQFFKPSKIYLCELDFRLRVSSPFIISTPFKIFRQPNYERPSISEDSTTNLLRLLKIIFKLINYTAKNQYRRRTLNSCCLIQKPAARTINEYLIIENLNSF